MTIEPDTKDWTWVLARPCPDCGFDARELPRDSIGASVRSTASAWAAALGRPDASHRTVADRWSVLEYGCHVRDVYRVFDGRLSRMVGEVDPLFDNWDQDETAVSERYGLQDPSAVRIDLLAAAEALAARYDGVSDDQWGRPGRRSNGDTFTVETLGRYMAHDPVHHLWDIGADRRTDRDG